MSVARGRLTELAGLFLKLGATAFGGPVAHIAMMEHEVVRRRETRLGKGVIERDIEARVPDLATPLILYCGGGFRSALAADNPTTLR